MKLFSNTNDISKLRNKAGAVIWSIVRFIIVFGLAFLIIKPFIQKILLSFMSYDDILNKTVNQIPTGFSTYYLKKAFDGLNLSKSLWPTLYSSVTVSLIQMAVSTCVGYGLARFKFRGRYLAFGMVILIMLVPPSVTQIAKYLSFRYFGIGNFTVNLLNTYLPLYLSALGCLGLKQGLYIYLMYSFFIGLPSELESAAYIDGASPYSAFVRVIVPNAKATMILVFLFSFCWQWTDTSYSSLYLSSRITIPDAIKQITIRNGVSLDATGTSIAKSAACIIAIIPLIAIFFFCQKRLIKSIAHSGLAN